MMLALLLLSAPSRLVAQTATGSIVGTVTDPSGAVLPGVTVTIKSTTTGLTETRSTTATGTYSVLSLEPGECSLVCGFGTWFSEPNTPNLECMPKSSLAQPPV